MPGLFRNSGFTIIEILIAVTIIVLITVVALPNLRNFNQGQDVDNARSALFDDLRLAKSKADAGIVCPGMVAQIGSALIEYSVILNQYSYSTMYYCLDNSETDPVKQRVYTKTEVKPYPDATKVQMSANDCGVNKYGTTIKFKARNCPANSSQCRTVEISCANGGADTTADPFVITLTNNQTPANSSIINVSLGGSIYVN